MNYDSIPWRVLRHIEGQTGTENDTGMSGSRVMVFQDLVLKIGPQSPLTENMLAVMRWLPGKLPAPQVVEFEKEGDQEFLLMTRVPGKMACSAPYIDEPEQLLSLLAQAIQMLWQVDWRDCPVSRSLDEELSHARHSLENGLVDLSRCEPETFGPGGFESPEKLLRWLEDNRPPLESAFSHGDCCLPNIFFSGNRVSGFIDLGDAGIADKWRDLSLCHRSLKHNTNGFYGHTLKGFDPDALFDRLGIQPDREKLRYYLLLDEFF